MHEVIHLLAVAFYLTNTSMRVVLIFINKLMARQGINRATKLLSTEDPPCLLSC